MFFPQVSIHLGWGNQTEQLTPKQNGLRLSRTGTQSLCEDSNSHRKNATNKLQDQSFLGEDEEGGEKARTTA